MKKICDYYTAKRRIDFLREKSANKEDPQTLLPLLKPLLKDLPLRGITIANEYIHRARWNVDGMLFSHVEDLIYPPKSLVKQKGRFNDVGESVFYAALCELGTIIESKPELNRLFTIIKIKRKTDSKIIFFPLGILDGPYKNFQDNKTAQIIIEYLNDEITKQPISPEDYNATITMAYHFFKTEINWNDGTKTPGLIYPSVRGKTISNKTTYNIAMLPCVFDDHYQVVEATVYCLTYETTHYELRELNKGHIETNGQISWQYDYETMIKKTAPF